MITAYPEIRHHITSDDTRNLMDQLNNGLIDSALIFTEYDRNIYQSLQLPEEDTLGVLIKKDSPLPFHPLKPVLKTVSTLIWKKYQVLSAPVQLFIDTLRNRIEN